jgi:hypothetical protein
MWGNPRERERDLIIQLQENTYQQQNHNFQPRKIHLQHTKTVPKICLVIRAKSVLLYDPPRKLYLEKSVQTVSCTDCSVWPNNNKKPLKSVPRKSCQNCLDFRALFPLLYGLYGSVQYDLPQQKNNSAHKTNMLPWDLCPLCLGKCALYAALIFLSQAYSKILSQSPPLVSCTLPNAFFYKSENDLFPPKCLFTFPNPKSKGQDLILPFARSRVMIHSLQNESLKILKYISLYYISALYEIKSL